MFDLIYDHAPGCKVLVAGEGVGTILGYATMNDDDWLNGPIIAYSVAFEDATVKIVAGRRVTWANPLGRLREIEEELCQFPESSLLDRKRCLLDEMRRLKKFLAKEASELEKKAAEWRWFEALLPISES